MISKKLQEKFKKLYRERYRILLTDEETIKGTTNLINLMKVLLKPYPKENK